MIVTWTQAAPTALASFLGSGVECVEALTIILAVGATRGWSGALAGCGAALLLLAAIVAAFGRALSKLPLPFIQLVVGGLLLLFGLRWLRKAILRSAGVLPLHDEDAAFCDERQRLGTMAGSEGWDAVAFATSFQITMLEGAEVVFIVLGVGTGGPEILRAATLGAGAAFALVAAAGIVLRRPLGRIPENKLKLAVGVLLSAFGTFWFGEGIGLAWPGADWSLLALVAGYAGAAATFVQACRSSVPPTGAPKDAA